MGVHAHRWKVYYTVAAALVLFKVVGLLIWRANLPGLLVALWLFWRGARHRRLAREESDERSHSSES